MSEMVTMHEMHDRELLRDYARTASEPVFAALVERYVGLVYSAALRQLRDPHKAEDITQAVFIVLARKAASLPPGTVLSGWLLKTTRYAANAYIRAAVRRAQREEEAAMRATLNEPDSAIWEQLAHCLDEAMASLGEADRNAIALRYFENRPWREVAELMQIKEDAAQKRVARALEKLRVLFAKRGVMLTAALIAGAVSANSVQAAPAGIATTISVIAASKGAVATASTLTLVKGALKIMTWTKFKTTTVVVAASLFAVCTTTLIAQTLIQRASRPAVTLQPEAFVTATLQPETFITAPGLYHWTNDTAIGQLTFRNNKTRSITLGTSQESPPGTIVVNSWTNAPSESKLTIRSNEVNFITSDGAHMASAGIAVGTWHPGANWFIYRAKGMRVWAYDGDHGLWTLTATPLSSESASIDYLQEQPPSAVLERLPDTVKKMLPKQQP